jgi:hypothetical protein
MTFGKYEGRPISAVPTGYLEWCLDNLTRLSPELRLAIRNELASRKGSTSPLVVLPVAVSVETALRVIEAGRRALAKTTHPDLGGDPRVMVEINATSDWLESSVRSLAGGSGRQ